MIQYSSPPPVKFTQDLTQDLTQDRNGDQKHTRLISDFHANHLPLCRPDTSTTSKRSNNPPKNHIQYKPLEVAPYQDFVPVFMGSIPGNSGAKRLKAIQDLITHFRSNYGDKDDFFVHDGVDFLYTNELGVHVRATKEIAADEVIMKILKSECLSYTSITNDRIELTSTNQARNPLLLTDVLDYVFALSQNLPASDCVDPQEITASVLVMYAMKNTTRFNRQLQTWPSNLHLEAVSETIKGIEGTFFELTRFSIESADIYTSSMIIELLDKLGVSHHFVDDKEAFQKEFMIATFLVTTRSFSVGFEEKSVHVWPLIDCINGLPECSAVNLVNLKDEDSKEGLVSGIRASRQIQKGEDLLLNYGPKPPTHFVQMYKFCPEVYWKDEALSKDYVVLEIPDKLRLKDSLRLSRMEDSFCQPLHDRYFLFPPQELNKWKETGDIPKCLRDVIMYLRLQSADYRTLRDYGVYEEELVRDVYNQVRVDKAIPYGMMKRILELFKNSKLRRPSEALIQQMKDPESPMSHAERTSVALKMLARDSMEDWKHTISTIKTTETNEDCVFCVVS